MSTSPTFAPVPKSNVTLTTVANSSVGGSAASWTAANGVPSKIVEVYNASASDVFVAFGLFSEGAVTAAATDYPVPAHSTRRIEINQNYDTIAAFLPTGGTVGSVYATRGEGGTSP